MTAEELARRVNATRRGREYRTRCPAHGDEWPSLDFKNGDHAIVFQCRSNRCAVEDILRAWGLTAADVSWKNGHRNGAQADPVVATYTYTDVHGHVSYQKHRTALKRFWFERPDGAGGWTRGVDSIPRHVYRRHELLDASEVYICEGEKDTDRLAALGLIATTNDSGAAHWTDLHTQQIREAGAQLVWILEDNDAAGRARGVDVAKRCTAAGLAAHIVRLPNLPVAGDVSDWLQAGHTVDEFREVCRHAPVYDPSAADAPDAAAAPEDDPLAGVREWTAAELLEKTADSPPVPMLIDGLFPGEGTTLLHAQPRALKTWLSLECGVALTTGTPALGLLSVSSAVPVLYVTNEDGWRVVGRRFAAILRGRGCDVPPQAFGFAIHAGVWLDDLAWHAWLIRRIRDVGYRVIILDPLRSLTACVDQGPRELQPFVRVLRRLMDETGVVPLLSHHDTKPLPGGQPDTRHRPQRASGGGLFSIADAPIHCERLGDDSPATSLVVPALWKVCETPSALQVRLSVDKPRGVAVLTATPVSARDVTHVALDKKILGALAQQADLSTRELARRVQADRTTVKSRCDALCSDGCVDSRPGPRNAELWFLTAQEKGSHHA